jgi:hypothetical protein
LVTNFNPQKKCPNPINRTQRFVSTPMAILPDQSTIVVNELFEAALATEKKRKCGTIMAALSNDEHRESTNSGGSGRCSREKQEATLPCVTLDAFFPWNGDNQCCVTV